MAPVSPTGVVAGLRPDARQLCRRLLVCRPSEPPRPAPCAPDDEGPNGDGRPRPSPSPATTSTATTNIWVPWPSEPPTTPERADGLYDHRISGPEEPQPQGKPSTNARRAGRRELFGAPLTSNYRGVEKTTRPDPGGGSDALWQGQRSASNGCASEPELHRRCSWTKDARLVDRYVPRLGSNLSSPAPRRTGCRGGDGWCHKCLVHRHRNVVVIGHQAIRFCACHQRNPEVCSFPLVSWFNWRGGSLGPSKLGHRRVPDDASRT